MQFLTVFCEPHSHCCRSCLVVVRVRSSSSSLRSSSSLVVVVASVVFGRRRRRFRSSPLAPEGIKAGLRRLKLETKDRHEGYVAGEMSSSSSSCAQHAISREWAAQTWSSLQAALSFPSGEKIWAAEEIALNAKRKHQRAEAKEAARPSSVCLHGHCIGGNWIHSFYHSTCAGAADVVIIDLRFHSQLDLDLCSYYS